MIQIEDTPTQEEEWWGEVAEGGSVAVEEEPGPVTVAHVANYYNRYLDNLCLDRLLRPCNNSFENS